MVVACALGSALLYAVASVLQQQAAAAAPAERSMRLGLLAHLVQRPLWLIGIAADLAGYALQFVALDRGSLVLVQPLLVSGLLFALPLGAALTHRRLQAVDWFGTVQIVAGLSLFLVVASPARGHVEVANATWLKLSVAVLVPVGLLVAVARGPQSARRAGLLASAAGLAYGFTAALTKSVGHLLDHGVVHMLGAWETYALVGVGILGMIIAQSAFQAGPLGASLPMLTVVDPLVSIAIGQLVFAERIATHGAAPVLELVGLLAIVTGVFTLARSPLVLGPEAFSEV